MSIIGCDLHSRYQVIAMVETDTGERVTRRLEHENGEARTFYASLPKPSLIGMEATGYTQWFERLVIDALLPVCTAANTAATQLGIICLA